MNNKRRFKSFWSSGSVKRINLPIVLLVMSILVSFTLVIMLIFPGQIESFDKRLKLFSNILPFFSLLFAWLALFVAVLAYKSSVLRPCLYLQVTPLQQTDSEVKLYVDDNNRVSWARPLNEWSIRLSNEGDASAKYPMVRMLFELGSHDGKYFGGDEFSGWEPIIHAHGRGYYGFQWTPDSSVIIYPDFSIPLPTLYFSGKHFENDFAIVFTFVADGVSTMTLRIPVKVIKKEKLLGQHEEVENIK